MYNHFDKHAGMARSRIQPYLRRRRLKRKVLRFVSVTIIAMLIGMVVVGVATLLNSKPQAYAWEPPVTETPMLVLQAEVTAYSSSVDETDERPWEMASGKTVYEGAIACPSRFEFGTLVQIGENWYTCEDRMGKRYRDGDYFDIWAPSKQEALEWGRQTLSVLVLL